MPHGDRDHFVYVWERFVNGRRVGRGIQVEHVTAAPGANEFEVALSEDGTLAGRVRARDDESALSLLSEEDLAGGLRLSYDPPLRQLGLPLVIGEQSATSTTTITRLSDGEVLGTVPVTQVVRVSAMAAVNWMNSGPRPAVLLRTVRTVQFPEGGKELSTDMLLVEGIGEVRSEGKASDMPLLRRQLVCAWIDGRSFGDCSKLNEIWEEPNHAGSSDLP